MGGSSGVDGDKRIYGRGRKNNTAKNGNYVHAKCSSSTVLYTCGIGLRKQSKEAKSKSKSRMNGICYLAVVAELLHEACDSIAGHRAEGGYIGDGHTGRRVTSIFDNLQNAEERP